MRFTIILSGESTNTRDQAQDLLLALHEQCEAAGFFPGEECALVLPGNGFNTDRSTPESIARERRTRTAAPAVLEPEAKPARGAKKTRK